MSRVTVIDGLPVVDAKQPLRLHVTKPDITKAAGDIKEPKKCAVARACYRELHAKEVRIHLSRAYVRTNESNWTRYEIPRAMRQEIIAFDRGGSFEPGEFVLSPCHQPLGIPRKGGKATGKGKKRQMYHRVENVRSGPISQS